MILALKSSRDELKFEAERTSLGLKVESLIFTSVQREKIPTAKVKTWRSQRRRIADHWHTLQMKLSGFSAYVAENVDDAFTEFFHWPITSFPRLIVTRKRGIDDWLSKSKALFREILAAFEV